jgi:hypothetical protein
LFLASPVFAAIDFAHQVVPVLKQHCAECHLGEKRKGGLSMNTRRDLLTGSENGVVVKPGKGSEGLLIEALTSMDKDTMMPPKGARVPKEQIEVLKQWINEGLVWEEGFTFGKSSYEPLLKPRVVALPPVVDGRENPIDRILDKYMAEHQVKRPQVIDDRGFARRLHLDLVGLLPDPKRVETFANSGSPGKRSELIAEVLKRDVDYAEHWMTFWNDLLRNDYVGTGYIEGGRKPVTNWLYQALVTNKPYDVFARELLSPKPESEGFTFGIKWRGTVNASQTREVQFAQSISQVFLGINMKCASCHDSFIDRWKLDEAYGLAAIYSDHDIEINRCDKGTGRMAKAAWIFPELGNVKADAPQPERLQQLAALMTHKDNGRFTRTMVNRLWHRMMGHGIVHPVDAMHTEPWSADLLDYLAVRFAEDGYDVKKMLTLIASSQAYQSRSLTSKEALDASKFVYSGPIAKRLTAEQFVDAVWQLTETGPKVPHASVLRGKQPEGVSLVIEPKAKPKADAKADPAAKKAAAAEKKKAAAQVDARVRASLVTSDLLMRSLGRPNREQIVTVRPENLTTLEAIDLENGNILAGYLKQGAAKMLASGQSSEALISDVFARAVSRVPTDDEMKLMKEFVGEKPSATGIEDMLWSVLLLPEFQFVR